MAVALFMISSVNVNANQKINELEYASACELYAQVMGNLFVSNGLNYYTGYFGGYADCVSTLGISGVIESSAGD
jgi:pimeloyl-CoA synthetase